MQRFLLNYKYRDAVKRLANGITHSYNNIFTGLSGQLSMHLRDGEHATFSRERKQLIESLLKRGIEQTGIFFEFCRLRPEDKKSCNPVRIAQRAMTLLNSLSRIHHVELVHDDPLPEVKVRFGDIVLLLFYLGENGFEAMSDGGMVRLEVRAVNGHGGSPGVRFILTDDGPGFPREVLEQERFLPTFSTIEPGHITGLGLYAVTVILDDHRGVLEMDSHEGQGATVSAYLPGAELVKVDETWDEAEVFHPPLPQKASSSGRYMLMVVDDEESMRNILLDQLQRRGHVAFSVGSCSEALKEFAELSDIITAVLLDVGLQEGSGYECIPPLREIRPDIIIIMMSGEPFEDRDAADPRTFYLKKPFTIEMVERICRS